MVFKPSSVKHQRKKLKLFLSYEGRTLKDLKKKGLTKDMKAQLSTDLLKLLSHLKSENLSHNDLKPENICYQLNKRVQTLEEFVSEYSSNMNKRVSNFLRFPKRKSTKELKPIKALDEMKSGNTSIEFLEDEENGESEFRRRKTGRDIYWFLFRCSGKSINLRICYELEGILYIIMR